MAGDFEHALCRACGRDLPVLPNSARVTPHDAPGTLARCAGSLKAGWRSSAPLTAKEFQATPPEKQTTKGGPAAPHGGFTLA